MTIFIIYQLDENSKISLKIEANYPHYSLEYVLKVRLGLRSYWSLLIVPYLQDVLDIEGACFIDFTFPFKTLLLLKFLIVY